MQIVYILNQIEYPLHILIKKRTALNDSQLWKSTGYLLRYVILYVDYRSESVSSVWAVRSMAFFYFYENSALICCIFQSHSALSKYRKAAMKFVFRFSFFFNLNGVTLCN